MSENGAGMLAANTNVSVIKGCFVTSIGVQCVKISPIEHVTCATEYCYYTTKINVTYQNNSFYIRQW